MRSRRDTQDQRRFEQNRNSKDQIHHRMKAYNIEDHNQQKLDFTYINFSKTF